MTDTVLTFKFSSQGGNTPVADLKKIAAETNKIKQAVEGAGGSTDDFSTKSVKGLGGVRNTVVELAAKYFLIQQALQAVVAAAVPAYELLIGQNEALQRSINQTAGSIAATNTLYDAQGREITNTAEAIALLRPELEALRPLIEQTAANITGVTADRLDEATQAVITDVGLINGSLEETVQFAAGFLQVFQQAGIPAFQLRSELRAIASGQRLITSQVAQVIGQDELKRAVELGEQVDFLSNKFREFGAVGAANANLTENSLSNLQTVINKFGREAGAELTEEIQGALANIATFVNENGDQIEEYAEVLSRILTALFGAIEQGAAAFTDEVADDIENLSESIDGEFVESAETAIKSLGILLEQAGRFFGDTNAQVFQTIELINRLLVAAEPLFSFFNQLTQASANLKEALDFDLPFLDQLERTERLLGLLDRPPPSGIESVIPGLSQLNLGFDLLNFQLKENQEQSEETESKVESLAAGMSELGDAADDADSSFEAVTKRTADLDARVETLARRFKQLESEIQIDALREQASIQQQLADGLISESDAALANAEAKRVELRAREEGIATRLKELEAIRAEESRRLGTDGSENTNTQILKAEQDLEKARLDLARNRLQTLKTIEKQATQDIAREIDRASRAVDLAETERVNDIQNALNQGVLSQREADALRLQSTAERLAQERQLAAQNLAAIEALEPTTADGRRQQIEQVEQARKRLADVITQQLKNERSQQQQLIDLIETGYQRQREDYQDLVADQISLIQDRAAAERSSNQATLDQLSNRQQSEQLLVSALDRQRNLLNAQLSLQQAQSDLVAARANAEASELDEALKIRKRLNQEELDPKVRDLLEKRLRVLTGSRSTSETDILKQRAELEQRINEQKLEQIKADIDAELRLNDLAQQRLAIEQTIAQIAAQTAALEAQGRTLDTQARASELDLQLQGTQATIASLSAQLAELRAQGADPSQIRDIERQLSSARRAETSQARGLATANQQITNAQQLERSTAAQSDAISSDLQAKQKELEAQRQTTILQGEAKLETQETANAAAEFASQLSIAEAKAKGTADQLERAANASNRIGSRGRSIPSRNRGGQMAAGNPYLVGDGPGGAITPYTEVIVPDANSYAIANQRAQQFFAQPAPVNVNLSQEQLLTAVGQLVGISSSQLSQSRQLSAQILQAMGQGRQRTRRQSNTSIGGFSAAQSALRGTNL